MTPQGARQKGQALQKYVRDKLLETFPQLEPDDVRNTASGQPGEDVQLSPAARKVFPYQVECKNKATSQLHTYFLQAKSHGNYEPLVIIKKNRSEVLVSMTLEHFLQLLKGKNETSS